MISNPVKYQLFLILSFLSLYIGTGYGVTITNDSLTNIEQVEMLDLWHRSSHFGFHFLSILSYLFFQSFGLDSPVFSTQFMLSCISIVGVVALFRIVLLWKNNLDLAFVVALIYGLNSNIWRFSVQNEYHVLVPALSMAAIALWLHGKHLFGAAVFGLATLTSPFAIFSLPLVFIKPLKINRSIIFNSIAGFLLVFGAVSLFTYKETLQGEWSYDLVFQYYKKTISLTNFTRVFSIYLYGFFRAYHIVLLLLIIFLIRYRKTEKRLVLLLLVGFLLHLPAAIPENRYGAYQMTLYPLIAICSGFVLHQMFIKKKVYFTLFIAVYIATNTFVVLQERAYHQNLSELYTSLQNDLSIQDSSYVFMYKATKPFNEKYAPRLKGISVYSNYLENLADNLQNYELPDYKSLLNSGAPVYLIESGVSMPDDMIKSLFSKYTDKQGAKSKGTGIKKIKEICESASFDKMQEFESIVVYKVRCNS